MQSTPRLRPGVELYATGDGHLLRVGDACHHVRLGVSDADALLDALVAGGEPASGPARAALAGLVAAGLVDPPVPHVTVVGAGLLAAALQESLVRMGARTTPGGTAVHALDDDALPPGLTGPACWVSGHRVVLAPPAVTPAAVAARHLAATRHRGSDPATTPAPDGRHVTSSRGPLTPAGLELAAVLVAAELLRAGRAPYDVVTVDLHTLTVGRHPVLPVPPAPR